MNKVFNRPFLLCIPFLLLYMAVALIGHKDIMEGDEARYYAYAQNLLHGYFSPPGEVFLWSGPGYPLLLAPFIAIGFPLWALVFINAFLQYLSLVYLYKTLLLFTRRNTAVLFSLFWALYYVAFREMVWLYTEPLTNMLVSLFAYHASLVFLFQEKRKKNILLAGFFLGYMALTKIVFGYVVLALLLLFLAVWLIKRTKLSMKPVWILLVAMAVNLPYLFYTYQLTGKYFYWANSGGSSIYWMSTPVEGEFGDWNDDHFTAYCGYDSLTPCNAAQFAKFHQADYDSIYQYNGVRRDEAFRKKAMENIKQHPVKYLKNCIANASRLFLGLPFSYSYLRMQNIWRIPPGIIVLLMCVFSSLMTVCNLRRMPYVIWLFIAVLSLYLGATIAVGATQRMLSAAVPLIIVWCAYIAEKTLTIRRLQAG